MAMDTDDGLVDVVDVLLQVGDELGKFLGDRVTDRIRDVHCYCSR